MFLYDELKRRNVLRVALAYLAGAWLLIQVAETLFPLFGLSERIVRAVVLLFAIGFIPMLVMAWVFEITPEGLRVDSGVEADRAPRRSTRTFDRVVIALMAAALLFFGVDKFILDPARDLAREEQIAEQARTDALIESYGDKSIAVLPFVNMSDDSSNEYFADGVSEELLNLLAAIEDLRVISRTSAFAFKGQRVDISTVAEELNVVHVLEGSVRKAGNQVRISAQLIDAQTDTQLWSNTYDRELDDIFAIQDEIAAEVVEQLQVTLGIEAVQGQSEISVDAYDHYLRGLQAFGEASVDGYRRAEAEFRRAVELQENFADAWYRLARTEIELWMAGHGSFDEAEAAAKKALEIDPNNGGALTVLSFGSMRQEEFLAMGRRAYEMSPGDSFVVLHYGRGYEGTHQIENAEIYFQKALDLDPLNMEMQNIYGLFNMFRGRADKAITIFDRVLELEPDYVRAYYGKGMALALYQGNIADGILYLMDAASLDPEDIRLPMYLASFYLALDDPESAASWIERAETLTSDNRSLVMRRVAHLYLSGRTDEALDTAAEAFRTPGVGYQSSTFGSLVVGNLLLQGKPDEAESFLLDSIPDLEKFLRSPPARTALEFESVGEAAFNAHLLHPIYIQQGRAEEANALAERLHLDGLERGLARNFEPTAKDYIVEARRLMRDAQPADALIALQTAVSMGYGANRFGFGWQFSIGLSPAFEKIRDDPEFQKLTADLEARMREQRALLEQKLADRQ